MLSEPRSRRRVNWGVVFAVGFGLLCLGLLGLLGWDLWQVYG